MKNKELIVTVNLDGTVEVTAAGYKGKSCAEASKFIEQALGLDTSKRKKLPEYFQQETVKQTQKT